MAMTDPAIGMHSFQEALDDNVLDLTPGMVDQTVFVHLDYPDGVEPRWTYVRLETGKVTAFVNILVVEPVEGIPCFGIGYAVPEQFRNQGRAKELVGAAIEEMREGFGKAGMPEFFVEAIIDQDNLASQHVASATLSPDPVSVVDQLSGKPAFQYVRRLQTAG
ncbi:MAG: GNAT family N-acetyltransferase [Mesorhizobium sp.]|nr:MAG: GNAT family N-acetyltransferase [Mesorhizobium sp.]